MIALQRAQIPAEVFTWIYDNRGDALKALRRSSVVLGSVGEITREAARAWKSTAKIVLRPQLQCAFWFDLKSSVCQVVFVAFLIV